MDGKRRCANQSGILDSGGARPALRLQHTRSTPQHDARVTANMRSECRSCFRTTPEEAFLPTRAAVKAQTDTNQVEALPFRSELGVFD